MAAQLNILQTPVTQSLKCGHLILAQQLLSRVASPRTPKWGVTIWVLSHLYNARGWSDFGAQQFNDSRSALPALPPLC
jgi:hypothetical protein